MIDFSPKFTKIFGAIASPLTLVVAVILISAWALTEGYLGLPKIGKFGLAMLTLFILWCIQRKHKREAKEIHMEISALTQYVKCERKRNSRQNGNGFKAGKRSR